MLKRSQSAPISLRADSASHVAYKRRRSAWFYAKGQMSRVKALNLPQIHPAEIRSLVRETGALPILESLRIHDSNRYLTYLPLLRFMQRPMPALRALDIDIAAIPRPLLLYPQLVSLKLYSNASFFRAALTDLEVLESLEAMPQLEHVELTHVTLAPRYILPNETNIKTVELPNLKYFADNSRADSCTIVSSLRYPPTARIYLRFFVPFWAHYQNPSLLDICSRLRTNGFCTSKMTYSHAGVATLDLSDAHGNKPLALEFQWKESQTYPENLLTDLCTSLPTQSIEDMSFEANALLPQWPVLLAHWPGLTRLDIKINTASLRPHFISALHNTVPKLEKLILAKCSTNSVACDDDSPLIDVLRTRQGSGKPMMALYIDDAEAIDLSTSNLCDYVRALPLSSLRGDDARVEGVDGAE